MKQYSVARLRRDAKEGIISAVVIIRNGESISQESLPEWQRGCRKIINSNTASLAFENKTDPTTPSHIWLPKASLIEYTDTYLYFYSPGYREPTEAEQRVLKQWHEITQTEQYQKQLEADCLTDGSSTYYQKLAFFKGNNMEYLMGITKQRGLRLDWNRRNSGAKDFIQDETIRGKIQLGYQIERARSIGPVPLDEKISAAAERAQIYSANTTERDGRIR